MVACLADVEDSIEIRCLSARCQHGGYTAFEGGYLGCNGIVRRILQTGVEVTAVFEVEQTRHLLAGIVFESCTLINGGVRGVLPFLGVHPACTHSVSGLNCFAIMLSVFRVSFL